MVRSLAVLVALCSDFPAAQAQVAPRADTPRWPLSVQTGSLELTARWERLTDTVYHFERDYPLIRDLAPAVPTARHDAALFHALLPPHAVAVGETWRVDVDAALPFLRQLHPGATKVLHHDGGMGVAAPGGFACLRALDDTHAEVVLRIHADFRIAGDGTQGATSWFTPAQFRGRLALDRRRGAVVGFELAVPAASANVDVNVGDKGNVFADIGRVPRMEVAGGAFPTFADDAAQVAATTAEDRLARAFYPFAAIEWLDLETARAESRESGKPLHVVALFGSLMDESC